MAAAVGEPWLTFYDPDEIDRKLRHAGFSDVQLVTPELANARYFAGRADELPAAAQNEPAQRDRLAAPSEQRRCAMPG